VTEVERNLENLYRDYVERFMRPCLLKAMGKKHLRNVPEAVCQEHGIKLISESQCWYDLLSHDCIGLAAGDNMAFKKDFEFPSLSPNAMATTNAMKFTEQTLKQISTAIASRTVKVTKAAKALENRAARVLEENVALMEQDERVRKRAERDAIERDKKVAKKRQQKALEALEVKRDEQKVQAEQVERAQMRAIGLETLIVELKVDNDQQKVLSPEAYATIKSYLDDPDFAEILVRELGDQAHDGDKEILDGHLAFLSQMAASYDASQSISKSSLAPVWKRAVHSKQAPPALMAEKVIDITHSDEDDSDDAGKDDKLKLRKQLSAIDWGGFGLSQNLVVPTLMALKDMSGSNPSLLDHPDAMEQILELGANALNQKNTTFLKVLQVAMVLPNGV
jgi:hypothetical protein